MLVTDILNLSEKKDLIMLVANVLNLLEEEEHDERQLSCTMKSRQSCAFIKTMKFILCGVESFGRRSKYHRWDP